MTTTSHTGGVRRWEDHTVVGDLDDVTRMLTHAHQTGRLIWVTPPRQLPDNRVAVRIRITPPTPDRPTTGPVTPHRREPAAATTRVATPAPTRSRRRRLAVAAGIVAITTTAVAAAMFAVGWLLLDVVIPEAIHLIAEYGLTALGVAVVVIVLGVAGAGTAIHHCPGCRH